jgi:hypothetical protein
MMRQIKINTNKGEIETQAYVHGKFAVNKVNPDSILDPAEALWAITHIATGLQVTRIWGRASARKLARLIDAEVTHDITAEDYKARDAAWQSFKAMLATLVTRS